MAIKAFRSSLEGLSDDMSKEYKEIEVDGKKSYVLDIEGGYLTDEPVDALKRARDYEKRDASAAKGKVKDLTIQLEKASEELDQMRRGAIPKGDVDKLEGSWKEKLARREAELTGELTAARTSLQKLLVDNVAQGIVTKISNAPDLLLPHVQKRLTTELTSDGYITRVLDREGKPSAMSIEELQKDLISDKRFSAIIITSKATGGGASGGDNPGSGASAVRVD